MQDAKRLMQWSFVSFISVVAVILFTGCQSGKISSDKTPAQMTAAPAAAATAVVTAATTAPAAAATPAATAASAPVPPPVRIKAGRLTPFTDSAGNVWLPDQGFADGDTTDRPDDLQIANTKDPALYRSERFSMSSFSYPVPNGKYTVKLHFAETFDGISGPGGRVFSFNVEGQEFKDFDVWVKAGGQQRACIETVNVEVADGKLDISFTSNVENPEINGIEILP